MGKQTGDPMEDLHVNLAIWRMLMNTTLQAAIHLGKDYDTNLHYAMNHICDSLGQLFGEIKRLICELSIRRQYLEIDELFERKSLSDHYLQSLCLLPTQYFV